MKNAVFSVLVIAVTALVPSFSEAQNAHAIERPRTLKLVTVQHTEGTPEKVFAHMRVTFRQDGSQAIDSAKFLPDGTTRTQRIITDYGSATETITYPDLGLKTVRAIPNVAAHKLHQGRDACTERVERSGTPVDGDRFTRRVHDNGAERVTTYDPNLGCFQVGYTITREGKLMTEQTLVEEQPGTDEMIFSVDPELKAATSRGELYDRYREVYGAGMFPPEVEAGGRTLDGRDPLVTE